MGRRSIIREAPNQACETFVMRATLAPACLEWFELGVH